jgi:hypothetical protein
MDRGAEQLGQSRSAFIVQLTMKMKSEIKTLDDAEKSRKLRYASASPSGHSIAAPLKYQEESKQKNGRPDDVGPAVSPTGGGKYFYR